MVRAATRNVPEGADGRQAEGTPNSRRLRADDHARSTDLAPPEERITAHPGRIVDPDVAGEMCRYAGNP